MIAVFDSSAAAASRLRAGLGCALLGALLAAAFGCRGSGRGSGEIITIDGSSTVYPISEAVAEEFQLRHRARVTIGVSGTGGGFKKFCAGETTIIGASRPIRASEAAACARSGVDYVELPVAYDGIAVVVHPDNDWVDQLSVAELRRMWQPEAQGRIKRWNQVRADWPDADLHLFGPGVDSGTYDYFTQAVVGKEHSSRGDFTSSENDNVLVQGVASDRLALGFFGYAYYAEHRDTLRLVAIYEGDGEAVRPSPETIASGRYRPLSRPVFVYVAAAALERAEVAAFMDFYVNEGGPLVGEVGYIPLPPSSYALVRDRLAARTTGSVFADGERVGVSVAELLGGGP